jgi:Tol biopolymer transport system component
LTAEASIDSRIVWFDRGGKTLSIVGERDSYGDVEVSPDDTQAAVTLIDPAFGTRDLWLFDLARGVKTRFTANPAEDNTAIWSPDGKSIVFGSSRVGSLELFQAAATRRGSENVRLADRRNKFPSSWSPDGRFIMYMVDNGEPSGWDLWLLPVSGDRRPVPFLQTPFNEVQGQFSPDGRWVAYASNESGRNEVYVTPFPGPGRTLLVSTAGGLWPRWSGTGSEIFYLSSDGTLMATPLKAHDSTLEAEAARSLFDARPRRLRWPYGVTRDGQRFLVNTVVDQLPSPNATAAYSIWQWSVVPITVVVNWSSP